ncbi:unnamed protein product [Camellia sinensis]
MAEEVKLFGVCGSPFSCRVEIALKLKGIPVLLHNGKPTIVSVFIVEYIDETWKGTTILPQDPYERATARFWAKFIDEKMLAAIWKVCSSKDKEQEKDMEEAGELLKLLKGQLKEGKKPLVF